MTLQIPQNDTLVHGVHNFSMFQHWWFLLFLSIQVLVDSDLA
jgi:hypothetical protein